MNQDVNDSELTTRLHRLLGQGDPAPGFTDRVQASLYEHAIARRQRRPWSRIGGPLVAAAFVAAFTLALGLGLGLRAHPRGQAGPAPAHHQTSAPSPPAASSTPVPSPVDATVVPCPTTFGVQAPAGGRTLPPLPATMTVTSGPPTGEVEWYMSTMAFPALAPAQWSCSAVVAADGGETVEAFPPGSSPTAPENMVSAYGNFGGCTGCVYQAICGLFPVPSEIPAGRCSAPAGRTVTRVNASTALYEDPAGSPVERGTVAPSDPNPIMGVVVYDPGTQGDGTVWSGTCVRPAGFAADCRYVLLQFAAWAQAQPRP